MKKSTLAATSLAVGTAAGTGSIASVNSVSVWFARLRKPPYQPPDAVFPIVWTTLYTDIAASSAVAIDRLRAAGKDDEARRYAAALGVNLVLNGSWSWLFFRYHKLGAAAIGAAALAASSADLVRRTAQADPRAGLAMSPYALWTSFATVLATHVWRLNR
ncbi:tryptophan-rich sensory protein [Mycobacterium bohemicum DSM 44277]|uniref:TspO protein n=2 Tax=Mycobacterium bohemicum TaxID=56425 RepID=A0A1X1R654_MYCBE|nr:TspO/MBR family protein [Mycobacterium bohemicum]MCV6971031.1 tryptophan-rich sensory protein [Mycobacterium bohemicum]ORV00152.1 TspO protein [Mycobacterium bohemicum]CPR12704.1 tryptophan-rich sensory protein [Mycobacterium bohemicum DSM 44277]